MAKNSAGTKSPGKKSSSDKSTSKKTTGKKSAGKKIDLKKIPSTAGAKRCISDVNERLFVAESPVHGKGMYAVKKIMADVVLGRLAGMPSLEDGIYILWLTDDLGLEVTNDFRFINHSKDANCALTDVDVVTLRPIEPGEELFHDYGW